MLMGGRRREYFELDQHIVRREENPQNKKKKKLALKKNWFIHIDMQRVRTCFNDHLAIDASYSSRFKRKTSWKKTKQLKLEF